MFKSSKAAGSFLKCFSNFGPHRRIPSSDLRQSRSVYTMPPGAWDSHVHVVNEEEYPFDKDHPFRPMKADLDDLLRFENSIGIQNMALVAISVYGNDNSLLLDRLRQLKGHGRGVVSIDPATISDAELQEMHSIGVRGVRINLKSHLQVLRTEDMRDILKAHANKVRLLKWSLHLHIELAEILKIYDIVPSVGLDVVFDHMATPHKTIDPWRQKGYNQLMNLLTKRQAYIKLSGFYRSDKTPGMHRFARKVLADAPTQVIWASDWPHTGGAKLNPDHDRTKLQEYRKVDVPAFIEDCLAWCKGDEELMRKILVENPRRLWQVEDSQD